jgi:hypothetical protein
MMTLPESALHDSGYIQPIDFFGDGAHCRDRGVALSKPGCSITPIRIMP